MILKPWLKIIENLKNEKLNYRESIAFQELLLLLEEFRVSIFAPELKTSIPISSRRLEKFIKIHFQNIPFVFSKI